MKRFAVFLAASAAVIAMSNAAGASGPTQQSGSPPVTQGSGGGLSGVGRYLRERNPAVRVFAVEPAECALLAHQQWGAHGIEGIGAVAVDDIRVAIPARRLACR